MITRNLEQLIIPQPSVPPRQLKKEDIAHKGLLQLQIQTKTTFQLWVTWPPKILRFSPYLPLPFTITQSISTTNTISSSTTVF